MFLLDYFYSQSFVFVCSLVLSGLKVKNYLKINMLIINYKMDMEPLQIKNKYHYDWDDIIIYDFNFDISLVKIFKRESKIGVNIYYIGYKPDIDDTITPLFFCWSFIWFYRTNRRIK